MATDTSPSMLARPPRAKLGYREYCCFPDDGRLTEHDIVQPDPDLVVVLAHGADGKDRTRMITHTKINGVPDLVVEILSPSTAANDTVLKKQLYERTGGAEYWISDPDNQRLEEYRLVGGSYRLEPPANPVMTFAGGLCVKLDEVW